jgi:predicted GIY-YIG superfamily endonuclease
MIPNHPVFNPKEYAIYVLTLQNGKYYVGMSEQVGWRFIQHERGKSSSRFVQENKPIIKEEIVNSSHSNKEIVLYLETMKTMQLIKKYGIENVSGGFITGSLERRKQLYKSLSKKMMYSFA